MVGGAARSNPTSLIGIAEKCEQSGAETIAVRDVVIASMVGCGGRGSNVSAGLPQDVAAGLVIEVTAGDEQQVR